MTLDETEADVAELDALFAPAVNAPVDTTDPDWTTKLRARNATPLPEQAGVGVRTEALLLMIIDQYAAGDDVLRAAIRRLFDQYKSFRWAAHLPTHWDQAADVRRRLIHLSAPATRVLTPVTRSLPCSTSARRPCRPASTSTQP